MNTTKEQKHDCYECEHRGTIPGSCHSCCRHPEIGRKKLNIEGNPTAIRGGWFMWPGNFDPVWLENCDGFEQKKEKD